MCGRSAVDAALSRKNSPSLNVSAIHNVNSCESAVRGSAFSFWEATSGSDWDARMTERVRGATMRSDQNEVVPQKIQVGVIKGKLG